MARWNLIICLVLVALSQINANGSTSSTVQDAIKDKIQSTAKVVQDQTTSLKNAVDQKKSALVDRVKTSELVSTLSGLQGKLDALVSTAGMVLDAASKAAVDTINTAVGELQKLVDQVAGILGGVVTALNEVLQTVTDLVGTLVNILGSVLGTLVNSLGGVLNKLLAQVGTLADCLITDVANVLHLQLSNINNAVDSILDCLEPKFIGAAVNSLSQVAASAVAAVLHILARAGNLIACLLDSLLYEVFGLLGLVGNALNQVLSSVMSTLGGTLQAITGCTDCLNGPLSVGNGGGIGGTGLLGRRRRNVLHSHAY